MFTVLMSLYARESASALQQALQSLCEQTVAPAEVLLVEDGPLPEPLNDIIGQYRRRLPLVSLKLPQNVGLAKALNRGLEVASQQWIMRFDTDDVCMPARVEKQTQMALSGSARLFGAQIEEFESSPDIPLRLRAVPCGNEAILRYARRRNPFNHMTVCYPRDLALSVGGYPEVPLMEDYALWITLLSKCTPAANTPDVLVRARVGNGMIRRRGGWRYVRSEARLQTHMVRNGFKSAPCALIDGLVRSAVFLSPSSLRAVVYAAALRAPAPGPEAR